MGGIIIGEVPVCCHVVAGADPASYRVKGAGHIFKGYPTCPVILIIFNHIRNEAFTLGANGKFACGLPADVAFRISENKVQGDLVNLFQGFANLRDCSAFQ